MTELTTRIEVAANGRISCVDPLPPGSHPATITLVEKAKRPFAELPTHDGHWDDRISMDREDLY